MMRPADLLGFAAAGLWVGRAVAAAILDRRDERAAQESCWRHAALMTALGRAVDGG